MYYFLLVNVPNACASMTRLQDESTHATAEFVSDNFTVSQKDIEEVEEGMKKLGMRSSPTTDEG